MNKESIYTGNFKVHSFDTDFAGSLKPGRLCAFLQEVAGKHASALGFGYEQLAAKNQFWVLSRLRLQIEKMPRWNEELTITTWPRGIDRLFGLRDFLVKNKQGKPLATASTYWLILDKNTHRPQRPYMLQEFSEMNKGEKALEEEPEKLSWKQFEEEKQFTVRNSEIDVNLHVNNTSYIDWIFDFYPLDFYRKHHLKELQINFLAETSAGDEILLKASPVGMDGWQYYQAHNINSDRNSFIAGICWKE